VLLGRGDGSLGGPAAFPAGEGPASVAVDDFNADSQPDLPVANERSNDVSVLLNNTATCAGRPATIVGGPTPDRIVGTRGSDVIVGGPGSDRILGRGGNDRLFGDSGADRARRGPRPGPRARRARGRRRPRRPRAAG
jgi:Ca2+-binding RTX toxin-like protein